MNHNHEPNPYYSIGDGDGRNPKKFIWYVIAIVSMIALITKVLQ